MYQGWLGLTLMCMDSVSPIITSSNWRLLGKARSGLRGEDGIGGRGCEGSTPRPSISTEVFISMCLDCNRVVRETVLDTLAQHVYLGVR